MTGPSRVPSWVPGLPLRAPAAHKGTVGKLGIVGGSPGLTGAVVLAQAAALRSGCGLVTCAVPESLHAIVATQTIEAMTLPLPDDLGHLTRQSRDAVATLFASVDAMVLGPGLGRDVRSAEVLEEALSSDLPAVFDADALWHLAHLGADRAIDLRGRIITPHEGELRRLVEACGHRWTSRNGEDVATLAHRWNTVIVAKGPRTIVATPGGNLTTNTSGNPGLASGGTGDVLAGIVGAFLARGDSPVDAAVRAVWLHGRAADFAAYGDAACESTGRPPCYPDVTGIGEESLIASDVIANLPLAIRELQVDRPDTLG